MKKKLSSTFFIGAFLVVLSLFLHYIHYLIFKDAHHTLIFLVADIAFIPMEVFFTSLVLDKLLEKREITHLLERLNILIGLFYTELGTALLSEIVIGDNDLNLIRKDSTKEKQEDTISFDTLVKDISSHEYTIDITKINLNRIQSHLDNNKELLIALLTNNNLLEHETFTETLMAVIHLKDELNSRYNNNIQEYEINHINKDLEVTYKYLTIEWAKYMEYLRDNYPVLFTKALINNPFDNRSKQEKDKLYLKI